jgi:hypothetical protein
MGNKPKTLGRIPASFDRRRNLNRKSIAYAEICISRRIAVAYNRIFIKAASFKGVLCRTDSYDA